LPAYSWKVKFKSIAVSNCYVKDTPRFGFRSFMFEVARNFQTKETIFKILDAMSLYKMNTFHFHFNDDEGWRLAIPSLPEPTEIDGKQGFTLDRKNFYVLLTLRVQTIEFIQEVVIIPKPISLRY